MQLFFSLCCRDNREQIRDWQKDRSRATEIRGREGERASRQEEVGGPRSILRLHHKKEKKTKTKVPSKNNMEDMTTTTKRRSLCIINT